MQKFLEILAGYGDFMEDINTFREEQRVKGR
jgi:hypothetical protein